MRLLSQNELKDLARESGAHCVSIYLPTHRAGVETQQNPIRLKNQMRQVLEDLLETGLDKAAAEKFLQPIATLVADNGFWQNQNDGLALFLNDTVERGFRLPLTFKETAIVGERFHLKPLLPLLNGDGRFYVLALSQNRVRLLEGSRYSVREIDMRDIPDSLQEALGYDFEQKSLQFHTGTTRDSTGRRQAVFHGHGAGDENRDEIARFCRIVDEGLLQLLEDRTAPMVLACAENLMPIYRQSSHYPNISTSGVEGNPDDLKPEVLHERAWALVEPGFRAAEKAAEEKYFELIGTGRASQDLAEVVQAAHDGRVHTLFVAVGENHWGSYDPASRQVVSREKAQSGDDDLLDLAALESLLHDGVVFAVPDGSVPGGGATAAVFRY